MLAAAAAGLCLALLLLLGLLWFWTGLRCPPVAPWGAVGAAVTAALAPPLAARAMGSGAGTWVGWAVGAIAFTLAATFYVIAVAARRAAEVQGRLAIDLLPARTVQLRAMGDSLAAGLEQRRMNAQQRVIMALEGRLRIAAFSVVAVATAHGAQAAIGAMNGRPLAVVAASCAIACAGCMLWLGPWWMWTVAPALWPARGLQMELARSVPVPLSVWFASLLPRAQRQPGAWLVPTIRTGRTATVESVDDAWRAAALTIDTHQAVGWLAALDGAADAVASTGCSAGAWAATMQYLAAEPVPVPPWHRVARTVAALDGRSRIPLPEQTRLSLAPPGRTDETWRFVALPALTEAAIAAAVDDDTALSASLQADLRRWWSAFEAAQAIEPGPWGWWVSPAVRWALAVAAPRAAMRACLVTPGEWAGDAVPTCRTLALEPDTTDRRRPDDWDSAPLGLQAPTLERNRSSFRLENDAMR